MTTIKQLKKKMTVTVRDLRHKLKIRFDDVHVSSDTIVVSSHLTITGEQAKNIAEEVQDLARHTDKSVRTCALWHLNKTGLLNTRSF